MDLFNILPDTRHPVQQNCTTSLRTVFSGLYTTVITKTAVDNPKACYESQSDVFAKHHWQQKRQNRFQQNSPLWPTSNRTYLSAQFHIWSLRPPPATQTFSPHLRSTKGFSGSPGQISSKTIEEVALLQLFVPPTSQKAEQWSFARLLAGLRHVSFMSEIPELLEGLVVFDKGLHEPVAVGREETGQTIGLGRTIQ